MKSNAKEKEVRVKAKVTITVSYIVNGSDLDIEKFRTFLMKQAKDIKLDPDWADVEAAWKEFSVKVDTV